jgi:NADH-quinone oxidoreductase subunit A
LHTSNSESLRPHRSAAADEVDDFVAVASHDGSAVPFRPGQDIQITLNGHPSGGEPQMSQQARDVHAGGDFPALSIDQNGNCSVHFDPLTPGGTAVIITSAPMTGNIAQSYAPLLLHILVALGIAGTILLVSSVIGWSRPSREKGMPYECGVQPTGDAREPFSVKFYLVAMIFILFDVEAVFLYPWAYVYRDLRWFGFFEMLIYILILLAGYIYLWKKGALDWSRPAARRDRGS